MSISDDFPADSILLESVKTDGENQQNYFFTSPVSILTACSNDEIRRTFDAVENALRAGYYVAGFCSYEAGDYFENIFPPSSPQEFPLLWFGVYRKSVPVPAWAERQNNDHGGSRFTISDVRFCLDDDRSAGFDKYADKIRSIKDRIRNGEVYQINFTGRTRFLFDGNVIALYRELRTKQRVPYSALIRTRYGDILSFSPELFFRKNGNRIVVRPMKGTAPRGRTLHEDDSIRQWLAHDEKSRAENIMIVDILRNDLGKIAETGAVRAPSLFTVERYETLFQMVSTVEADLKPLVTAYDLFAALFPSGSVTGAPKISAMKSIAGLESSPRNLYTGAIGVFEPHQSAVFSVAIRTIFVKDGKGEMGTGGGIVWDSDPEAEYKECLLKTKFLTEPPVTFDLIESLKWQNGFAFRERHLKRMRDSAEYFGFRFHEESIKEELDKLTASFDSRHCHKVRVLLSGEGEIHLSHERIDEDGTATGTICLAKERISSSDRFVYHKTTHRPLYDRCQQKARALGYEDVIFLNENGEITEGTFNNIFIQKNGKLFTPPVDCGLLNGIYRQTVLETRQNAVEKILTPEDVRQAESVYLCNAVRGMRPVTVHWYELTSSVDQSLR